MNIVVCCKFVPSVDDLSVGAGGTVSLANAEWKINEFDLNAVEAGVALAKETGGKLIALSVGDSHLEAGKLRKDLLSRGPEEMYQVIDPALATADASVISRVLAKAIEKIGADIVLCGDGSEDYYSQQTGLQTGERLGWTTIGNIDAVKAEGGAVVAERLLEKKIEVLNVALPAVLTVTTSINTPPRPNMRAVLAAGKKPVTVWSLADVDADAQSSVEVLGISAPDSVDRKNIMVDGETADEVAEKLAHYLKSEGVL